MRDELIVLASAGLSEGFNAEGVNPNKIKLIQYNEANKVEVLQALKEVERAYFVVSLSPMSSSAYQAMIYSLCPLMLQWDCWKITLENAKIPLGFAFMRHLPEGMPPLHGNYGGNNLIGNLRRYFRGLR